MAHRPPTGSASPQQEREQAEEEAIQWMIALQEESTDADMQRRFRLWIAARHANARAWEAIAHVHALVGQLEPAYAIRTPAPSLPALPVPARLPSRVRARFTAPVLLALACTICIGWLSAPYVVLRLRADYSSDTAQLRTISLPDGSKVELAPRSAIAVQYDMPGERQIRLLRGEAFFSVTPNPARPFRVIAPAATVTVLGTAFDIRDGARSGTYVSVDHGRVRVDPAERPGHGGILTAMQAATIDASGAFLRGALPPVAVAAWRKRQIIVQDESVSTAIDRLRPWFGGVILTRGDALPRQRLTGIFNAADPVEALRGIARAYGGRVTCVGNWLILYSQE